MGEPSSLHQKKRLLSQGREKHRPEEEEREGPFCRRRPLHGKFLDKKKRKREEDNFVLRRKKARIGGVL